MRNLIIGIGQCGINLVKDISGVSEMSGWQTVIIDDNNVCFDDYNHIQWNNVYLFCGFGGQKIYRHVDYIIDTFHPLTPNLLFFGATPYGFEGRERGKRSDFIVDKVKCVADITVVQHNDSLLKDSNLSEINAPIIAAIHAAMQQSDRPLFYALSGILESTGIHTGLKSVINTDFIDILVNETRLRTLVNEAIGISSQLQSPEGVRNKMQELWRNHQVGATKSSKIFEIQLPRPDINDFQSE